MPTILISCPVNNRYWVLSYYLDNIYNIDYPKELINIYWVVNNCTDNSLNILKEFKDNHKDEYKSIKIEVYNSKTKFQDERIDEIRKKHTYLFLAELRNKILKECIKGGSDYLFSCDSDILVSRDILHRLLSHNKEYVASLIYNGYLFRPQNAPLDYNTMENAYKFPNILRGNEKNGYTHVVNYKVKNPNLNPIGELIDIDFTGAVFLVTCNMCNIAKFGINSQGEDEVFCREIKNAGYNLYCDLSCYSQHMMNKNILDLYLDGKLRFFNGDIIKI